MAARYYRTIPPGRLAPWEGDLRLKVHVQPTAELGAADVQVIAHGPWQGAPDLDDPRVYAATLRHLAAHLVTYADQYEQQHTEGTAA